MKGRKERIGRMVQMHANNRNEIKEVRAGDIAAVIGLKDVSTGETLCAKTRDHTGAHGISRSRLSLLPLNPKSVADQDKLVQALGKLAQEDPSFRVETDKDSGANHYFRNG